MAECLLWGLAAPPANAQRYQQGDVVAVFENNHVWGTAESLPVVSGGTFWIVLMPATPVSQVQSYINKTLSGNGTMTKRRTNGVDVTQLNAATITALNAGPITVTKQNFDTLLVPR